MLNCELTAKKMPPDGRFDPDSMTDVQEAFWVSLTDQRVAAIFETVDLVRDMPKEAKDFLRNAEPETLHWLERASAEDIERLKYSIKFTDFAKGLGKFWFWLMASGLAIGVAALTLWEKFSAIFVKAK